MNCFKRLWADEAGVVLSAETVMLGTIGVLGVTAGVGVMTSAMNEELLDMSRAFRSFDQSFQVTGYQVDGPRTDTGPANSASDGSMLAMKTGSGFQQESAQIAVETMSLQQVAAPMVSLSVVAQDGEVDTRAAVQTDAAPDHAKSEQELRQELRVLLEEFSRLQATQQQPATSP